MVIGLCYMCARVCRRQYRPGRWVLRVSLAMDLEIEALTTTRASPTVGNPSERVALL
jgi:hypothetical protein